jgi:hypothetical protein
MSTVHFFFGNGSHLREKNIACLSISVEFCVVTVLSRRSALRERSTISAAPLLYAKHGGSARSGKNGQLTRRLPHPFARLHQNNFKGKLSYLSMVR